MIIVIIIIIVVIAIAVASAVISNKLSNKLHSTIMKSTGLGNKLNENFDSMNAKALKKLEEKLQNGEITQEQYEKRKKILLQDFDFNK